MHFKKNEKLTQKLKKCLRSQKLAKASASWSLVSHQIASSPSLKNIVDNRFSKRNLTFPENCTLRLWLIPLQSQLSSIIFNSHPLPVPDGVDGFAGACVDSAKETRVFWAKECYPQEAPCPPTWANSHWSKNLESARNNPSSKHCICIYTVYIL